METRWMGLVLIALLAGLVGGFISSYVVYQPQIVSLKSDLDEALQSLDVVRNELDEVKSKLSNLNITLANLIETLQNTSAYTRYEKLEIPTAYTTFDGTKNYFNVTMVIKNTGPVTATIDVPSMLLNGKPANAYPTAYRPVITITPLTLEPGQSTTKARIDLKFDATAACPWQHGMTVEIMIHTVAGKDYPKVVVLP